jgi:hypothetical protein
MLVTERMQALGGHARSSRQPPLKERRLPNAIEGAPEQDVIDETVLETDTAHESVAAPIVDDAPPQTVVHENANGAVAEITADEEAAVRATVAAVLAKIDPQPATTDDKVMRPEAVQEDAELDAAKRAIMHEWENWSALHSDEVDDPNVSEYFFRHLKGKRPNFLNFAAENKSQTIRRWLFD